MTFESLTMRHSNTDRCRIVDSVTLSCTAGYCEHTLVMAHIGIYQLSKGGYDICADDQSKFMRDAKSHAHSHSGHDTFDVEARIGEEYITCHPLTIK